MRYNLFKTLILGALALTLGACASIDSSPVPPLSAKTGWVVLPLENLTDTPLAGQRAAALAASLLSARGFDGVTRYADGGDGETLFDPARSDLRQKGLEWARGEHARYALTGSVIEWRYKVGVDGEPVVGLTLQLLDVDSGKVIWSASGTRAGWGRDSLSSVAAGLEQRMLAPLTH
jgi:polysaccharide biosynthesis protein PelC